MEWCSVVQGEKRAYSQAPSTSAGLYAPVPAPSEAYPSLYVWMLFFVRFRSRLI